MFALTEDDLSKPLLGCADGPASFNAELTALGGNVVSADPLYAFGAQDIRRRIEETGVQVLAQTRQNRNRFVWRVIPSVEELGRTRLAAMDRFLADYEAGRHEGRYVAASLPVLPFADRAFDLSLCSHFLFLYSDRLDADFHCAAIAELCRVAREVRIFPLMDLEGSISPYLPQVKGFLTKQGYMKSVQQVDYEFQKGGHRMLRIRAA